MEVVYRDAPGYDARARQPADASEALAWLESGNRRFAGLATEGGGATAAAPFVIETNFGVNLVLGREPEPRPFGIVLGCADSRVPIELVFGRAVNDLFVVRVAGNTAGDDAIASLTYAAQHFPTVRTIVVLGHTQCGAVATAVDVFLKPRGFLDLAVSLPLRSLIDRLQVGVRVASMALQEQYGLDVVGVAGYPWALLRLTVFLNAAYVAHCVRATLPAAPTRVVFGVYDVVTREVMSGSSASSFADPPENADGFRELALGLASEPPVRDLLQPAAATRALTIPSPG